MNLYKRASGERQAATNRVRLRPSDSKTTYNAIIIAINNKAATTPIRTGKILLMGSCLRRHIGNHLAEMNLIHCSKPKWYFV